MAECGTHALLAATMGPLSRGETTLAREVLGPLRAGMLLGADWEVTGADLWRQAQATGAELVWRTRAGAVLPVLEAVPDGSSRSQLSAATDRRHGIAPAVVGVVEDRLGNDPGRPGQQAAPYRLLTTILDPSRPPQPSWPRSPTSGGSLRPRWLR
jgi:hypothetical protein